MYTLRDLILITTNERMNESTADKKTHDESLVATNLDSRPLFFFKWSSSLYNKIWTKSLDQLICSYAQRHST